MTASPAIIDAIMTIMERAFDPAYGEAWNRRQVTDALSLSNTHSLVIDSGGKPFVPGAQSDAAGFVLTRQGADEEELLLIAVDPRWRERGLGKSLISQLFALSRARGTSRIFLEMRRGNPAEHLYRRTGFEPIGSRPNYYRMSSGERIDAITFGCSI